MKSVTKNILTESQIRQLVKVNFGDTCRVGNITELKGGMFNSAYLIERLSEGDKIVLKVSVAPGTPVLTYENSIMPTEVEVFRLIAEHTEIPTPKVLAYDFSKNHISSNYFFMTAMKGETLQAAAKRISKQNRESIKKDLATYFVQLHKIHGDYLGYFTEKESEHFPSWKDAFYHMFDMILNDGKSHGIKLPYERMEKALRDKSDYLDQIKTPSLADFDLWEGNIFVIKEGERYKIEGVLDFERAFWGDPYADFPTAFVATTDIRKEEAFLNTYLSTADKEYTEADAVRFLMYRMYIFTIMAVEVYRYGFLYSHLQEFFSKKVIVKCLNALEQA